MLCRLFSFASTRLTHILTPFFPPQVCCSTCSSPLGTVDGTTVRLSKYLISLVGEDESWIGVLLATLQYAAASHGARRFHLSSTPSSSSSVGVEAVGVEAWLFSRAQYSTSLSRHWASSHNAAECVWKGYRVLYRPPANGDSDDSERVDLPESIAQWTIQAMQQCNDVLPEGLRNALTGWNTAFLARPHVG